MAVTIDLAQKKRGFIEIPFFWRLQMPVQPQQGCFKKLFNHHTQEPDPVPLVVVVDNIKCDKRLVCKSNDIFVIEYNKENYYCVNNPNRVMMTSNEAPFKLMLNADAITDCVGSTKGLSISARMAIFNGRIVKGEKVDYNEIVSRTPSQQNPLKIVIEIIRPKVEPRPYIDITRDEVKFSRRDPKVDIGELIVKSNTDLAYVPEFEVNTLFKLFIGKDEIPNAIILGNRTVDKGIIFKQTIWLDMSNMVNPTQSEIQCSLQCTGNYYEVGRGNISQPIRPDTKSFSLLRDEQGSALEVYVDDVKVANGSNHLTKQTNFTLGTRMTSPHSMIFRNISTDVTAHGAGVFIKNFKYKVGVPGAELLDANGNIIPSEKIMPLTGSKLPLFRSDEGLFLPNGIGEQSEISLRLVFDPTLVSKIKWPSNDLFLFSVICNIEFDYYEDREGKGLNNPEEQLRPFKASIRQPAYLEPNPQWLCVDYGSSAIAAVYDNKIIDLHKRKTAIIAADMRYSRLSSDTLENGSPFLSSDILMHDIPNEEVDVKSSSLSSQQRQPVPYSNLAICLSPTSSMIIDGFNKQLPCLKMLVGREMLPANPNYDIHYYYYTNPSAVFVADLGVTYTQASNLSQSSDAYLLSVMNVLRESYHELFRYFIVPEVGDIDQINCLVLTYPNTYTPVHLSMIRRVVSQLFPSVRLECLRFVSESDAVAAYYMSHWKDYHVDGADPDTDENIMVYDMGAGTLDVTLLQKHSLSGSHELHIVGKLGSCKAGNYLDFVIAQILCSPELGLRLNSYLASVQTNDMHINERIDLKLAIKSQVKPKLSDDSIDTIEFTHSEKNYKVSRHDIVNDRRFIEFLEDTTGNMITRLSDYLGKQKIIINTVLMSGRSCRLDALQRSLRAAVERVNISPNCEFVMLDNPLNGDGHCRAKTSVAEGAIAIADKFSQPGSPITIRSRRLYANYGIAFQNAHGKWTYIELLNHNNVPAGSEMQSYQFQKTTVEGLGGVSNIKLVQSYLNQNDTLQQLKNNEMEYISVMGTFSYNDYKTELISGRKASMSIVLNENDEISLKIGTLESKGQTPSGNDLESETSQCSFWPIKVKY